MAQPRGTTTRTTKEQWLEPQDLNSSLVLTGSNLAWNTKSILPATYTLAGNYSIPTPDTLIGGMFYTMALTQDSTGSRIVTWGNAFEWHGGVEPELDPRPGTTAVFMFYCDGTRMLGRLFYRNELFASDNFF